MADQTSQDGGRYARRTHITLVHRADWLVGMVTDFLDAPVLEMRAAA